MRGFIFANVYIGILLVSIDASVPLQRVHQKLSHEPVHETFDTPEILLGHEAVPIDQSHISKRSVYQQTSLHMKSFGNDIPNWLMPPDEALFTMNTQVYAVQSSPRGVQFSVYENAIRTYMSEKNKGYKSTSNNRRWKRQVNGTDIEHLIDSLSTQNAVNNVKNGSEHTMNNTSKGSRRTKRSYVDVVYPEILVIVDYDSFKLHGQNVYNTIEYLVGFWYGVDLLYRSLESPRFRLHIAAIVIAQDDAALSYLSSNKLSSVYLKIEDALDSSQRWLYERQPVFNGRINYDVAVTMTPLTMCMTRTVPGRCIPGAAGLSYYRGACLVNDYSRMVQKSSIVHDMGSFRGIQVAAHELGHTFGAKHDGDPYNFQCHTSKGNIMDLYSITGANSKHWSQCSLVAIDEFIRTNGRCLYNQPRLVQRIIPFLPGKMMDANQQCRVLQGTQATQIDATICQEMPCFLRNSGYSMSQIEQGAAPGTPCGYQKICLHGQCIWEASTQSG